jgi:DNA-binding transcriptional LysR family regulator
VGAGIGSMASGTAARCARVKFDWNDLRFFAAVLEHGTTVGAARAIGVDQTTVARRITALEAALGIDLFERDHAGYRPTPAAELLQPSVLAVSEQMAQFVRQASTAVAPGQAADPGSPARKPSCGPWSCPPSPASPPSYPDVQLEIDLSPTVRDLVAGEADIAVRAGPRREEPSLVRRRLSDDPVGDLLQHRLRGAHGAPRTMAELADHPIRGAGRGRAGNPRLRPRKLCAAGGDSALLGRGDDPDGRLRGRHALHHRRRHRRPGDVLPGPDLLGRLAGLSERLRRAPEVKTLSRFIAEAFR